jgi:hypothetical protein
VIDRALFIDDISVLTKAYLRRGLAYEHCEKFKLAANDLARVRNIDPMNKQARDSLARCLKCIKQDEGIDYVPEGEDIAINGSNPELEDEIAGAATISPISISPTSASLAESSPVTVKPAMAK